MAKPPMMPAGLTPDISTGQTDIQNILLLNILNKTTGKNEFADLIKLESSYLIRALNLLKHQPVLRLRFGGYNLDAGNALAKELKARTDAKEIDYILEKPVEQAINQKYDSAGFKNELQNPLKSYKKLFLGKNANTADFIPAIGTDAVAVASGFSYQGN